MLAVLHRLGDTYGFCYWCWCKRLCLSGAVIENLLTYLHFKIANCELYVASEVIQATA